MIVVADAAPLRYLILLGHAEILPKLYRGIVIPSAVKEELTRVRTPPVVQDWMQTPPAWLTVMPAVSYEPVAFPSGLGTGEREAIALAQRILADALLVDDRAARMEAARRGLIVVGTVRVLADAADRGLLDFEAAITSLRATNFRIDPRILKKLRG